MSRHKKTEQSSAPDLLSFLDTTTTILIFIETMSSAIATIAAAKQAHRVIEDGKEALALLEEDPRIAGSEEEWNALLTEAHAFGVSRL